MGLLVKLIFGQGNSSWHDPEKSILEVQDYDQAIMMSAQTALRESMGRHELHQMWAGSFKRLSKAQPPVASRLFRWAASDRVLAFRANLTADNPTSGWALANINLLLRSSGGTLFARNRLVNRD